MEAVLGVVFLPWAPRPFEALPSVDLLFEHTSVPVIPTADIGQDPSSVSGTRPGWEPSEAGSQPSFCPLLRPPWNTGLLCGNSSNSSKGAGASGLVRLPPQVARRQRGPRPGGAMSLSGSGGAGPAAPVPGPDLVEAGAPAQPCQCS